jgi:hypothetical protein
MIDKSNGTEKAAISFIFPDAADPVLAALRDRADLRFDGSASDMEKALTVIGYAHGLFTHDGDSEPTANDPLTIIDEALAGGSFRCVEYSLLATALLWAYGIPARKIGLKTSDVETREYGAGHVVIEFWDQEGQKWVMCDVQAGLVLESADVYLSAHELGETIKNSGDITPIPVNRSRFKTTHSSFQSVKDYTDWVNEYLCFIDAPLVTDFEGGDLREQRIVMLVPEGVTPPKRFQDIFDMNALYTHDPNAFYPLFSRR